MKRECYGGVKRTYMGAPLPIVQVVRISLWAGVVEREALLFEHSIIDVNSAFGTQDKKTNSVLPSNAGSWLCSPEDRGSPSYGTRHGVLESAPGFRPVRRSPEWSIPHAQSPLVIPIGWNDRGA